MSIPFSKKWRTARKCNTLTDKAIATFDAQYRLLTIQGKSIETTSGINKRALGYLDGFIYSAAEAQGLDLEHPYVSTIFIRLYHHIWGEEAGRRFFQSSLEFDDEMRAGFTIGTNDFWFSSQTGRQPTSWFGCFDVPKCKQQQPTPTESERDYFSRQDEQAMAEKRTPEVQAERDRVQRQKYEHAMAEKRARGS